MEQVVPLGLSFPVCKYIVYTPALLDVQARKLSWRPYGLPFVVMIVSPSSPHAVVVAVASNVRGLYEVDTFPMFR